MSEKKTWDKTNQWTEELELLKSIIVKTPLTETTKWGGIVYTYNNKNVLGIGGFKNFFTIWFFKGVFLKDEKSVLVNANEGNTKSLRQWRFTDKSEVNEKLILSYINEAIEVEKDGLEIKAEKRETVISETLQQELETNKALKTAFEALTSFKQREYAEFMKTAKREATKLSRLEKIKPMILKGIGLNDKYR